ncbi:MAG: hypothetical protein CMD28_00560 [Flavobacteriales bacterium]|nr:hypothetical protein [Flavobacteriales bacterium]
MKKFIFLLLFFFSISLIGQNKVNPNLFGFRTSLAFVFFDIQDSIFMNEVKSISPNVLSFPGGFGNFYHLEGAGYGIKLDEIKKYHKQSKIKTVSNLKKIMSNKNHQENYIYDFIEMVKKTGSSAIYDANIISSDLNEVLNIIKLLLDSNINLLGVELGGELSNRSYSHFMNIDNYISLSKLYAKSIREVYKELPIAVVSAPNNRGSIKLENWNNKLAKENFYDAIIIHPYAKIVKGKDVEGRMLTVIPEGADKNDAYEIYKNRAIKYIILDFKLEIDKYNKTYNNKTIWLTEWNLQMSSITGNTLLQALFVAHQLIELASLNNSNIDIATFHNLAGRTISGSMIMSRNNKTNKNASFNSMRIVKELFRDSLFLAHKSEIKKDCFEYCFMLEDGNKKLYYWINWTGEPIKTDVRLTGKKSEYFGENLFDKNSDNTEFQYNMMDFVDSEVKLAPYSVTLFEVINN